MIVGLGSDLVNIRRIDDILSRFGDRFVRRVFTENERYDSDRRVSRVASYAKRFAAKEACLKALGTGLCGGISWQNMGVVNLSSGKPVLQLTGNILIHLKSLLPPKHDAVIHLTLTDDYPMAQALIVIEARSIPDHL